jgi:hypothetical protein
MMRRFMLSGTIALRPSAATGGGAGGSPRALRVVVPVTS